ncbi:hypothetical protein GCM10010862_06460 [Devosia nitrariae]|uniref:Uncharacterized protein n=1 Tax=Devosia nitrariae TaxID=2071872 RepID=A0ABQ5W0N9_9HYPH|nr:hypothetical protein GCM10010862_06460 [Devosia nitrariae]
MRSITLAPEEQHQADGEGGPGGKGVDLDGDWRREQWLGIHGGPLADQCPMETPCTAVMVPWRELRFEGAHRRGHPDMGFPHIGRKQRHCR